MIKNLVVIPTYNEKENIITIIDAVFVVDPNLNILVVDDNSPDGTAKLVENHSAFTNQLFLLKRKHKEGIGPAYISGFKWALEKKYDHIIEMDADFSHNPKYLPELIACCKNSDVAIGSRYYKGINVVNWPLARILISYGASRYVKLITGLKIEDSTSGFVCYRADVLRKIDLDKINFSGYAFQIEMKYKSWKLGFKLKEVEIVFRNREFGMSKMDTSIFCEALIGVIKLRLGI